MRKLTTIAKALLVLCLVCVLHPFVLAAGCNASSLIGTKIFTIAGGPLNNWCAVSDTCSTGYVCCVLVGSGTLTGTWSANSFQVTDCVKGSDNSASGHNVDGTTVSEWRNRGYNPVGELKTGIPGVPAFTSLVSSTCAAGNRCALGEKELIMENGPMDTGYCLKANECCGETGTNGNVGGQCNVKGSSAIGNAFAGMPCCDSISTCLQENTSEAGECRLCARKPDNGQLPAGSENTVDDLCSNGEECCAFGDSEVTLTCVAGKCKEAIDGVTPCVDNQISAGQPCGYVGADTTNCENKCPGSLYHQDGDQYICDGLADAVECKRSCQCATGKCGGSPKSCGANCLDQGNPACAAPGQTLECCDSPAWRCWQGKCSQDPNCSTSSSTFCTPGDGKCCDSAPCVGGHCSSGSGGASGGVTLCKGTGCGGDCGAGRSCNGGFCSAEADPACTPKPVDFSKYGYSGPEISNLSGLLAAIFNILYAIGLAIGIFMIVKSGYALMTSQGEPNAVRTAQEDLTSAVLGILFILLSITILRVIINSLLGSTVGF